MESLATITSTCSKCASPVFPETLEFNGGLCDRCHTWKQHSEDTATNDKKRSLEQRQAKWLTICPERYRNSQTDNIDTKSFNLVLDWRMSNMGLLCTGDSLQGKTTSCWKLLEKLYVLHGIKFEAMTEIEFAQNVVKRGRQASDWLDAICFLPLLFMDDIGHSSRSLEELKYVVEKRTAWRKPIIATTQYTPDEMTDKAGRTGHAKTVQAILNRLRVCCKLVRFG